MKTKMKKMDRKPVRDEAEAGRILDESVFAAIVARTRELDRYVKGYIDQLSGVQLRDLVIADLRLIAQPSNEDIVDSVARSLQMQADALRTIAKDLSYHAKIARRDRERLEYVCWVRYESESEIAKLRIGQG